MTSPLLRRCATSWIPLALASAAFASTITVDDSGGADFTSIAAAVAAASEGDVIVVREGTYAGFDIVAKSLVVRAESGASVRVDGTCRISMLASHQHVELVGLDVHAIFNTVQHALVAQDNLGAVAVRECSFLGATPGAMPTFIGSQGAHFASSALIILQTSSFVGGNGQSFSSPGFSATASSILMLDSFVRGGNGEYTGEEGGNAATAAVLVSSDLRLSRSILEGGDGADGGCRDFPFVGLCCFIPGQGGDGLRMTSSTVLANDTLITPGARGDGSLQGNDICNYTMPPDTGQAVVGGVLEPLVYTPICFGYEAACPCGNRGFGLAGCATSSTRGGRLVANGAPGVANDSLRFTARDLPANSTALLFQGTTTSGSALGVPFGDGSKCVGGAVIRLSTRAATNGVVAFGQAAGDLPISLLGSIPPQGGVRYYQAWFRDTASFCTSAAFNVSDALEVVWTP